MNFHLNNAQVRVFTRTTCFLLLIFAAALVSCAKTPSQEKTSNGELPKADIRIPFRWSGNKIFIKGRIGSIDSLWFIFDTGNKFTLVDLDLAKKLKLELNGEVNATGGGSKPVIGYFVQGGSINFDSASAIAEPIKLAIPLAHVSSNTEFPIAGIIGTDFYSPFVFEVDFDSKILTLHNRESYRYNGPGKPIPIRFDSHNHPNVQATLRVDGHEPMTDWYQIDLGASQLLNLNSPFIANNKLTSGNAILLPRITGHGVAGLSRGTVGRIVSLSIGEYFVTSPIANFFEDTVGAYASTELAGGIGAGLLSRFRVILDYERNELYLETAPNFREPFEYDMSGLALLRGEGIDCSVMVEEVYPNSPAADSAIQKDDCIVAVNGTPTATLGLAQTKELLTHEGTVLLEVIHLGNTRNVTLVLKRLI